MCGLFTMFILFTWHIIKRTIFCCLRGLQKCLHKWFLNQSEEILFGKEVEYEEDVGDIKKSK